MVLNPDYVLLTKIVDLVVDTVVEEFPDNGDIRLSIYEQLGENLLAMARCLRGESYKDVREIIGEET